VIKAGMSEQAPCKALAEVLERLVSGIPGWYYRARPDMSNT
jgi:hypothetical protein